MIHKYDSQCEIHMNQVDSREHRETSASKESGLQITIPSNMSIVGNLRGHSQTRILLNDALSDSLDSSTLSAWKASTNQYEPHRVIARPPRKQEF